MPQVPETALDRLTRQGHVCIMCQAMESYGPPGEDAHLEDRLRWLAWFNGQEVDRWAARAAKAEVRVAELEEMLERLNKRGRKIA